MTSQPRGADTRHAILENAMGLFSSNGYDATSVAEICQQAAVSKGAFYHHFPSKQDLFLALMETWLEGVNNLFQSASDMGGNIPEALEKMAGVSGGFFDALERGFPMLLEFWTQASRQPAFWQQVAAPYRRYLDYFSGVVQAGIDEGTFEETLDPQLASRLLLAIVMGLLLQASLDPEGVDWQDATHAGIKMILDALRSTQ